jgi:hypothetical protein
VWGNEDCNDRPAVVSSKVVQRIGFAIVHHMIPTNDMP